MSALAPKHIFIATLALAALLLALALWPRDPQVPRPHVIAMSRQPLPQRSLGDTSLLGSAALFNPERKAAVDQTAVAAAPPAALPDLTGIIRSGGNSLAMIRKADGGQAILKLGQSLDGWQLVAVQRQSVTLAQNGQRQSLKIKRETPAATPADTAAPAATAAPIPDATAPPTSEDKKP